MKTFIVDCVGDYELRIRAQDYRQDKNILVFVGPDGYTIKTVSREIVRRITAVEDSGTQGGSAPPLQESQPAAPPTVHPAASVQAGSSNDAAEYERMVQKILEERIRSECPGAEPRFFHNKKYRGKSGQQHQIDVSAELLVAGCRVLILAECKKYSRKITTKDVLEFKGRLDDIGAAKGIIVTTIGSQAGAERIAKANGIGLVRVTPPDSASWDVELPALVPPFLLTALDLVTRAGKSKREPEVDLSKPPPAEARLQDAKSADHSSKGRSRPRQQPLAKAGAAASSALTVPGDYRFNRFSLRRIDKPDNPKLAELGAEIFASGGGFPAYFYLPWRLWPWWGYPFSPYYFLLHEDPKELQAFLRERPWVEKIHQMLPDYEGQTAFCGFQIGVGFSLEFSLPHSLIIRAREPLATAYALHASYWVAVYGRPDESIEMTKCMFSESPERMERERWFWPFRGWPEVWRWEERPPLDWPLSYHAATQYFSLVCLAGTLLTGERFEFAKRVVEKIVADIPDNIPKPIRSGSLADALGVLVNNLLVCAVQARWNSVAYRLDRLIGKNAWLESETRPYLRFFV